MGILNSGKINLLFVLVVAFFSSCTDTGDFEMNFKATMANETLVLAEAYDFGEIKLKFEKLTFYVTDIALVNDEGEEVSLSEAEFLDIGSFDEAGAEAGQTLVFRDLPSGTYSKLKWTMGVVDDLNAKQPGDFDISEPLGRSDHYWEAWDSYIFSKTEGSADVEGDDIFDLKFFYHTGSDALSRDFEYTEDIVISVGEVSGLEFSLDYNELLKNADGSFFDIEAFPKNHNIDQIDIITQMVNNYVKALKIKR